ncbi:DEAD/DEAH box helicase [Emericellopsis atlantica]|uniref:DEAD/DEAH box helicase n=1 Tax=Emericellopsis atlantica TaxID=2614577 RepID=A0A9P7ZM32_9HYPO|nr:DEAD/DEAH box helicase [Emericellopsis atlantica]KAG9254633.1 DEAD/DEAH box helicase [Emericellopsis atlantica]
MASSNVQERQQLLNWYANLRPDTLDIVGEFAGRELFVVHGESLIRHCLTDSKVDYNNGFQLLHAIFAVEQFLSNLAKRGCNFDILFFSEYNHLCVPDGCSPANAWKYQLTRSILIRHLARSVPEASDSVRPSVLEFEDFEDSDFLEYMRSRAIHFALCHDGEDASEENASLLRHFIHEFISRNKNVAVMNAVEWKSSKIFAPLISGTEGGMKDFEYDPDVPDLFQISEAGQVSFDNLEEEFDSSPLEEATSSLRASVSVAICQAIRESTEDEDQAEVDERIRALLLHTAMLETSSLQDRLCPEPKTPATAQEKEDRGFLREFGEAAHLMIEEEHDLIPEADDDDEDLEWDMFDLIDGRIFYDFVQRLRKSESFPPKVVELGMVLIKAALGDKAGAAPATSESLDLSTLQIDAPVATAFSNPVFDPFLKGISLEAAPEQRDDTAKVVFEDLASWHNSKRIPVVVKREPAKVDPKAMRRNQRMERDMVAYSASLTNSRGKLIDPETIVANPKKATPAGKQEKPKANGTQNGPKGGGKKGGKKGGPPQKGGRAAALAAVQDVQKRKAEARKTTVVHHWSEMCAEFENDPDLISRYLKADKFAYDKSSKDDAAALGSEIELYMCHILGKIWRDIRVRISDGPKGFYLMAMIFNWLQQCTKRPSTPAVNANITKLIDVTGMPQLPLNMGSQPQDLSFKFDFKAFKPVKEIVKDYQDLQLEFGGPYMDRRFYPQPDDRVRFDPDAWQREVLDSIDAKRSLLVIAPTSAGKTFISFYAMKQVLEESDDGVIVYVAPTKALVNQIAAEINAQFSKKYDAKGAKSVWAIYTKDARVHNPTGCQILVTVPEILQIMLLNPNNAIGTNPWSKRVKRIIFDEVHSIGQAEDGVIWEQLLLQAPCPIIALSATVGNPEEFKDWLALSQSKKGYKMDLVVHKVRYSELRKFIYEPSNDEVDFKGLKKSQRLPVPGLDEGNTKSEDLRFLHPLVAMNDRNRGALGDMSFESRDCFTLYNQLKELLPSKTLKALGIKSPKETFPDVIAKSDVIKWEDQLKAALRKGMEEGVLDFEKLRSKFDTGNPDSRKITSHIDSLFSLAYDLHQQNALPALAFNYDRGTCERAGEQVLKELLAKENAYKETSSEWKSTMRKYEEWVKNKERSTKDPAKGKDEVPSKRVKGEDGDANRMDKLAIIKNEANAEVSKWESFDPNAPLEQYSFADHSRLQRSEFDEMLRKLEWEKLSPWLTDALHRGIGIHHDGLNRRYRQTVEILFRKGFLRLAVATGTLALGINMPCKTVIFTGDSTALTAQNYRQASGRAGRRGFDLLGNVVFNGIPRERVYEIMSSRLPDLKGQLPVTTSLILRLCTLLDGTKNSEYAVDAVKSLLSQTHLYLGGPEAEESLKHHLRFSIEYLRRQKLLSETGAPLNFANMIGHLHFTEHAAFAFHALLKGGYFHRLCADIDKNPDKVMLEMMLVLSHVFNRLQVRKTEDFSAAHGKSSSLIFLPRLPEQAEKLLMDHNADTLATYKDYVRSYISHQLQDKPDRVLPFTKTAVGEEKSSVGNVFGGAKPSIRSPFIALSGHDDGIDSIPELCATARGDVFLEKSVIPYLPIWPHDTPLKLNAYLYDFFKHGSMELLIEENHIKRSEVWYHLKDFTFTLAAIIKSLEGIIRGEDTGEDMIDLQQVGENIDETKQLQMEDDREKSQKNAQVKKVKAKLQDDWDDDLEEEDDNTDAATDATGLDAERKNQDRPAWQQEGGGLLKVLQAFGKLREEFDTKFKKTWA